MAENFRCGISCYQTDRCGFYKKYPNDISIIKLEECDRDITTHLKNLQLLNSLENNIRNEADLICQRVGLFTTNPSLSVCPHHRARLGINFKRAKTCSYPMHTGKGKPFRSISTVNSAQILDTHGVLVPVGSDLTKDKQVEVMFDVDTAERNIHDWKCHIVRGVAQDLCRHEHFERLSVHEVVVIMDWAMKFLPSMYREKQSDWFAQKGFNWHVIVCVFKDSESNLKHTTFVHVMDSAKQDWYSVACLLQHVLSTLKQQRPMTETAFLRSDNAGCYHCSNLWNCLSGISNNTGIKIERYDFSECQNGKSYCDAKIAHMRGKLRNYVKMGGNITSAADMKMALDNGHGVTGCQIAHVEICASEKLSVSKIQGISKISNVKFGNDSITYWRNYSIGKGQDISFVSGQFGSTIQVLSDFKQPLQRYGTINKPVIPIPGNVEDEYNGALNCPDPQCNVILATYTDLNNHCLIGNHHYLSTFDEIKMKWRESCLDITRTVSRTSDSEMSISENNVVKKRWALKKDRKNHRFSEKVRTYLKDIFEEGEKHGCKSNPTTVSRNMRICMDESGRKRFQASDYLNSCQVASYFSRLAAQTRQPGVIDADLDATISLINKAEALEEINPYL